MRLNIFSAPSAAKPAKQRYPWPAPAAIGVVLFGITYWVIPNWASVYLASLEENVFYPILAKFIGESIDWLQRFGAGAAIAPGASASLPK